MRRGRPVWSIPFFIVVIRFEEVLTMGKIFLDVNKVRAILLNRFWTLKELSKSSGVTYPTICACLGKKKTPVRVGTLEKICGALSVPPSEIVE